MLRTDNIFPGIRIDQIDNGQNVRLRLLRFLRFFLHVFVAIGNLDQFVRIVSLRTLDIGGTFQVLEKTVIIPLNVINFGIGFDDFYRLVLFRFIFDTGFGDDGAGRFWLFVIEISVAVVLDLRCI